MRSAIPRHTVTFSDAIYFQNTVSLDQITVQHNQTLRDVAKTLTENSIGAVPVLDGFGALVGILSERDLFQSLPQDIDLDSHMASDLMKLMTDHKIRHIPIVKEDQLLGIVSIGDVVKRLLEKLERETEQLRTFINS